MSYLHVYALCGELFSVCNSVLIFIAWTFALLSNTKCVLQNATLQKQNVFKGMVHSKMEILTIV